MTETEDRVEDRAIKRRALSKRVLWLACVGAFFYFQQSPVARAYLTLCAGCALLRSAWFNFPKGTSPVNPGPHIARTHPQLYYPLKWALEVFTLFSWIGELSLGIYILGWTSILYWLGITLCVGSSVSRQAETGWFASTLLLLFSIVAGTILTFWGLRLLFA